MLLGENEVSYGQLVITPTSFQNRAQNLYRWVSLCVKAPAGVLEKQREKYMWMSVCIILGFYHRSVTQLQLCSFHKYPKSSERTITTKHPLNKLLYTICPRWTHICPYHPPSQCSGNFLWVLHNTTEHSVDQKKKSCQDTTEVSTPRSRKLWLILPGIKHYRGFLPVNQHLN